VARRTSIAIIVGLAYLAVTTGWIYFIANTSRHWQAPWDSDGVFFAALVVQFLVGLAIGRAWALALPLAAAFLAIPAGYAYGEHAGEFNLFPAIPIWAGMLLASLIFISVMLPGIFLGTWLRLRAGRAATRHGRHVPSN
jgi:hypothetical protein